MGYLRILIYPSQSRIFRLTKLKFNCVYLVRLTPEAAADARLRFESPRRYEQHRLVKAAPSSAFSSASGAAEDVVAGCFCTRSCHETKIAWGTEPIECPAAGESPFSLKSIRCSSLVRQLPNDFKKPHHYGPNLVIPKGYLSFLFYRAIAAIVLISPNGRPLVTSTRTRCSFANNLIIHL